MSINRIIKLSIVAAIYVVLTVAFEPISYGYIQFRISEVLVLLCFFRKDYIYALILGCFIANLFSPMLIYDITFGVTHTIISVVLISRMKNLFISTLIPSAFTFIIAFELNLAFNNPFWLSWLYVAIGEFTVVTVVGYSLFSLLRLNKTFMMVIEANQNIRGGINDEV